MLDIHLDVQPRGLMVYWGQSYHYLFHPLWLRENSMDAEYRDENIGARIPQATDHPLDIAIDSAQIDSNGNVNLMFSDGHSCDFPVKMLRDRAEQHRPDDLIGAKVFWGRGFDDYPTYELTDLQNDESRVLSALGTLAKYGFVHVQGLAIDAHALKSLCDCVGPMRETNWGTLADVRNIPNPYDLTMTARSLAPHADNPYRLPAPGYIFMQCLRNNADGGESIMVDGFGVADALRKSAPEAFDALTTIAPNFRHAEDSAILEDSGPLIELNEAGDVQRVRFSNRTEQVPPLSPTTLDRYYRGRKQFADLIFSDEHTLTTKLQPGDAFIWDNYRIFHGRTAFDITTGDRHMRHCYLDRDTVSSRQKCLMRDLG
ncbi:MAG: DUF971 domain-containing protein [Gammaproteobacteria bacterium]|nr:DUF971 domain-containing protein [Gammaproteobacteria bacterium]NKB65288.1 DUF971 domain-containing protein [Gammaproteobacteria bacterium]